jgi:hypothetical protein
MHPNLTPKDFDWLRKTRDATDAKRDPPPVPMEIAGKLRKFGFVTPNGLSGLEIQIEGAKPCWNRTCGTPKTAESRTSNPTGQGV